MALELVTGYWGMEHVTAEQDADLNAGIIGSGNYVLNIGEKMRAEAVSANQVRIFDGVFMAYGRQCILGDGEYEDVTIENGTPGLLRNDMIVVKYKKDEESGKENAKFVVLKGETGSVGKDPVPNKQDIRSGAFESEVPMYRVKINGLAIEKIEPLYSIPMTNDDLSAKLSDFSAALVYVNLDVSKEGESFTKNLLLINTGNPKDKINATATFYIPKDKNTWKNLPSEWGDGSEIIGLREVVIHGTEHAYVKITEFHPHNGRIWSNFFNAGAWSGWKVLVSQ